MYAAYIFIGISVRSGRGMTEQQTMALVAAWHDAVNSQDIDRLLVLSAATIEITGPRGSAYGHAVLRDWLGRAGLHLLPQRLFVRDSVVVVAHHATWRDAVTGNVLGEADVASCFRVANNQIIQYARYDNLDDALAAGRLAYADQVMNIR
ncbi:MAG: nuclear transport factor 2 family protein [Chloroflexales bacterium]|nr:nuclear transport factor 2 family protein [Chloroflexales bacterium]